MADVKIESRESLNEDRVVVRYNGKFYPWQFGRKKLIPV